jgi:ankyrin repeat protein
LVAAAALIGLSLRARVQAAEPYAALQAISTDLGPANSQYNQITLIESSRSGRSELASQLLERGADPDPKDGAGLSALTWAIRNGDTSLVRRLLLAGAKLAPAERDCGSDLHVAADRDDPILIGLLLGAKSPVDARAPDLDQSTALHLACEGGHLRTVITLLEAGAHIEARDAQGFTPLLRATLLSRSAVVETLLARGANANVRDDRKRSALHYAAAVGDPACVRLLLEAGGDAQAVDAWRWTALHFAAAHGRADTLGGLVSGQNAAYLNARTARGMSALHLAARRGQPVMLQRLLEAGLDPASTDDDGRRAGELLPPGRSDAAWLGLGARQAQQPQRGPLPALLDSKPRAPLLCMSSHPRRTVRGPRVLLDLALWEDGAMVFAPWSADGVRNYTAGVLAPEAVTSVLKDLDESTWFDDGRQSLAMPDHDSIALTLLRNGRVLRTEWDEVERSRPDAKNRAADVERALAWSRVQDIVRGLNPNATQELGFTLVRGSFRGLNFADGAQAEWLR